MAPFLVFVNFFSKIVFLTKRLNLKIKSAASSGEQGTQTYFMYFPWPPLEADLSISMFCFLFKRGMKLFFRIYTLFIIHCSPKEIT
jgi:hypothetical protein